MNRGTRMNRRGKRRGGEMEEKEEKARQLTAPPFLDAIRCDRRRMDALEGEGAKEGTRRRIPLRPIRGEGEGGGLLLPPSLFVPSVRCAA